MTFLKLQQWHRHLPGCLSLALLCASGPVSAAYQTPSGQLFQITKDGQRPELNRGILDVDKVDTFSGALRINHEDARLRGNAGLDLVLYRNYVPVMEHRAFYEGWEYQSLGTAPHPFTATGLTAGWSLALAPKVVMTGQTNRGTLEDKLCSGRDWFRYGLRTHYRPDTASVSHSEMNGYEYGSPEVYTGYSLEHVNGQVEALVPTQLGEVRSASGWKLTCSGAKYTLHDTDGTKFEMSSRGLGWVASDGVTSLGTKWQQLQANRIVDANGNALNIEYVSESLTLGGVLDVRSYPTRISSSDGTVFLSLAYDTPNILGRTHRFLREVTDNGGRSWKYRNQRFGVDGQPGVRWLLTDVTLPDGTSWKYDYWDDPAGPGAASHFTCAGSGRPGVAADNTSPVCQAGARSGLLKSQQYPTGGTIAYDYLYTKGYHVGAWPWEYFYDLTLAYEVEYADNAPLARFAYSTRVKSRTLSTGHTWTYDYRIGESAGELDVTTVYTPDGAETYKHFGWAYFADTSWVATYAGTDWPHTNRGAWKMGLLAEKTVGGLYAEYNEWAPLTISTFWPSIVTSPSLLADPHQSLAPVLASRRIVQDGATYTQTFSNFDAWGAPGTVVESGPNGGNRTKTLTYLNDTAAWIIGKPKDESWNGNVVVRGFDGRGNLLSESNDGVLTTYTYDGQGNIATKTLPRSLVHTYSNYKRGIAQHETQPEGIIVTRVVDGNGNLASETNGEGKTTSYAYDAMNRVTLTTYPIGNPKSTVYAPNTETTTRGALVETTTFDEFGRPSSVTREGMTRILRHDGFGRKTLESEFGTPTGTGLAYDALSRIARVENADASFQLHTYGPGTRNVTDELGHTTTYHYRSYGDPEEQLLIGITAPEAAASVTIERNANDLVSSVTQDGVTRSYGYNANRFVTSVTNPESGTTVYGRDAAGNMTSRTVGGVTTGFTYDGQNRLVNTNYPAPTASITSTYNKVDKLLTSNAGGGNRSFTYDDNGNRTSDTLVVDGRTFHAIYAYNGNDALSAITYPQSGRVVQYAPDAMGRPTQASGYINAVTYWPSGQVYEIAYGNGTVTRYLQNERIWPSTFETRNAAGGIYTSLEYYYNGPGNLTTVRDTRDGSYDRTLGYDAVNRLKSVSGPWGAGSMSYSGSGNILSQTFGAWVQQYNYVGNRLNSVSGSRASNYGYDAAGNVTSGDGSTYTYDAVPNLRCANCNNATGKVEYTYDGLNFRSTVTKGGIKAYEMYGHGGNQLIEYTPQSNKLVEYIYLGGKRVAQQVSP